VAVVQREDAAEVMADTLLFVALKLRQSSLQLTQDIVMI
jgi:hypothetical protein